MKSTDKGTLTNIDNYLFQRKLIMKILVLSWNSYCNEDIVCAFIKQGHTVCTVNYDERVELEKQNQIIQMSIDANKPDVLFSFNYFPLVSELCMKNGIRYIGWVYDSPYLNLYSYTITNECNSVYTFDYAVYEEFALNGISTVHYLPMGVNASRLQSMTNNKKMQEKHNCDVSFVGSLYTEPKHDLYAKFETMSDFAKGYLDGIIQSQLNVYGINFLENMLTPSIVDEMEKAYPTNPNGLTVATDKFIYADYVLSRKVTAIERNEVIRRLSEKCRFHLYTNDASIVIGSANNLGNIDYYDEMPYVFKNSKINLNISLRSIKTGIPLRAWDIMGCGGFLLTNYQQEFLEYFDPDSDFVYYEDMGDLEEKVHYYLENDEIRIKISQNGLKKVLNNHTFENRIPELLKE